MVKSRRRRKSVKRGKSRRRRSRAKRGSWRTTAKGVALGLVSFVSSVFFVSSFFYKSAKKKSCPNLKKIFSFVSEKGKKRCFLSAMYVFEDPNGELFRSLCPRASLIRNFWRSTHSSIKPKSASSAYFTKNNKIKLVKSSRPIWFEHPVDHELDCAASHNSLSLSTSKKKIGVVIIANVVTDKNKSYTYLKFERAPSLSFAHARQALFHYFLGGSKEKKGAKAYAKKRTETKGKSTSAVDFDNRQGDEVYFSKKIWESQILGK